MPQILNTRLLYRASKEREQANEHFAKSDRLRPITIIVFGLVIVFALVAYFIVAGALMFLCYALAFTASHNVKKGNQHWHRSRQLVIQARQQAQAQIKATRQATRDGIEAGENLAQKGQALVPLLNTTPGGTAGGTR